ncbi:hypothetical protein HW555_007786 [Spodoptera exigua]|uniref:Uncharacterized protein n=2 Tax=Spodoptera exigua TaxID=7107 RepID=A0A835L2C2_SPOEX|nr:hypothetical protein HW555_007786 [Spodoptera exigua]
MCAESVTRMTGASVAERELKAALGALGARRSRKDISESETASAQESASANTANAANAANAVNAAKAAPVAPNSGVQLPSFAPSAVSPDTNKQWNDFIAANNSQRLQIYIYNVTFLALILNCLQRYD